LALVVGLLLAGLPAAAYAGAFLFVREDKPDRIAHPSGYNGTGGVLTVEVCIDPTSVNAADMVLSVENVARTYSALLPTTGNLLFDGDNNIPSSSFDFESTVLHEVGHCLGLGHPNVSSSSGLSGDDRNYTKSTDGVDNVFNIATGVDGLRGSNDDVRGDDINLHWFRKSNNNPFTIGSVVDLSTYSRTASLPVGHLYAENCDRDVADARGFADTECSLQQGTFNDEAQRTLGHDDVAQLRIGMSGHDEVQGTSDDYTLQVNYVGLSTGCDIVIDFDNAATSFAKCSVSGSFSGDHGRITAANIYLNDSYNWFFNDVSNAPSPTPTAVTPTPTAVTPTPTAVTPTPTAITPTPTAVTPTPTAITPTPTAVTPTPTAVTPTPTAVTPTPTAVTPTPTAPTPTPTAITPTPTALTPTPTAVTPTPTAVTPTPTAITPTPTAVTPTPIPPTPTPPATGGVRMYDGSLLFHAFGHDTTTHASYKLAAGVPFGRFCNTRPLHAQETLTFPTTGAGTMTFMFTVPNYGGQLAVHDTNADGIPDVAASCLPEDRALGRPLTGPGKAITTTGTFSTSRTPGSPRGIDIPAGRFTLKDTEPIGSWSESAYGPYDFKLEYASLSNAAGIFRKDGGVGNFTWSETDGGQLRGMIVVTEGANQFGGTMRLLGTYYANSGKQTPSTPLGVGSLPGLIEHHGAGGITSSGGAVVAPGVTTETGTLRTTASGNAFPYSIFGHMLSWTTGTVSVTAAHGPFPTVLARHGFDNRTAYGSGEIQLVTPMLTRWVWFNGNYETADIGVLKLAFAPEPQEWLMLAAGISMLGLLYRTNRRRR
jgi:hypothetical protein